MLAAMPDFADVDVSSPERFLASWYGPPDRPAAVLPDLAGALSLPGPLRAWCAVTSRYRRRLTFHNTVLPPDKVYQDAVKWAFWVENQEVVLWAFDPQGDDPMVHERANVEGEPWHPTGCRCRVPAHRRGLGSVHGRGAVGTTHTGVVVRASRVYAPAAC
jgi:hypothetical protein